MKRQVWLAALLTVLWSLCVVSSLHAQDPACPTLKGKLLNYDNTANCTGNTAPDVGHRIQYSTNGGSTWVDGPNTTSGGIFYLTPPVQSATWVQYRAKTTCSDMDHPHKSCDEGQFYCDPANSCTLDVTDTPIHTRGCFEAK
jgi:hypothetical protein